MAFKVKTQSYLADAERALSSCLDTIPFVRLRSIEQAPPRNGDEAAALVVRLGLERGKELTLLVECKSSGEPRLARDAVNQLLRLSSGPDTYGVFMAPYISPKAAEICIASEIGYIDLAGNCHLSFDNIYIERQGTPNPFRTKRKLRSIYSKKTTRVLRTLLSNPKRTWKLQALADESRVSLGLVSNVKERLLDREWAVSSSEGLSLAEPEALLQQWVENYDSSTNISQSFYSLQSISELENALALACRKERIKFALTSFSAAVRYAPAVRYRRVNAFVSSPERLARALDIKAVDSGANLILLTPYDDGVFYEARDYEDIRVVSPIQAYLDVRTSRERGEEAAEALLEQTLRPSW